VIKEQPVKSYSKEFALRLKLSKEETIMKASLVELTYILERTAMVALAEILSNFLPTTLNLNANNRSSHSGMLQSLYK